MKKTAKRPRAASVDTALKRIEPNSCLPTPAPPDLTFDYAKTRLTPEEAAAWQRPAVDSAAAANLNIQLVSCKARYIRGSEHALDAWPGTGQIPVVRLYGVTATGASVCVHVRNFAPYLFVNPPVGAFANRHLESDMQYVASVADQLYEALNEFIIQEDKRKWARAAAASKANIIDDDIDDVYNAARAPDPFEWAGAGAMGGLDRFGEEHSDSDDSDDDDGDFEMALLKKERKKTEAAKRRSVVNIDDPFGGAVDLGAENDYVPYKRRPRQDKQSWEDMRGPRIISVEACRYRIADHFDPYDKLVFKVRVRTPNMISIIRNAIDGGGARGCLFAPGVRVAGPTYDSGMQFENRFMLDHDLVGTGWFAANGARRSAHRLTTCSADYDIDESGIWGYDLNKPENAELYATPSKVRILSHDIECIGRNGRFPQSSEDPVSNIHCVGFTEGDSSRLILDVALALGSIDEAGASTTPTSGSADAVKRTVCFSNERELLDAFAELIVVFDPDIITGYNIVNFDIRYLIERAQVIGAARMAQMGRLIGQSVASHIDLRRSKNLGNSERFVVECEGRVFIDMMTYVQNNMYKKLRSYRLNAVAAEVLNDQKEDVDHHMIPILFNGSRADRKRLKDYCRKDALLPYRLMVKLMALTSFFELTRAQRVQLDQQQNGGASFRIFSLISYTMRACGFIVPYRRLQKIDYQGATVFEPERGYYNDQALAVMDFGSLYPSVMIAKNLCTTARVLKEDIAFVLGYFLDADAADYYRTAATSGATEAELKRLRDEVIYTCPVGHCYVRAKYFKGVVPRLLELLLALRAAAKKLVPLAQTPSDKSIATSREGAVKTVANSVYGFHGLVSNGTFWYWIAESTTAGGRDQIQLTKMTIESHFTVARGYPGDARVIYGDTDSVMVLFGVMIGDRTDPAQVKAAVANVIALASEAGAMCTALFDKPNQLNFENVYYPYLLVNKKRYGGQMWMNADKPNDEIKVRGLESQRRDNCRLVSTTQKRCMDLILKQGDPDAALKFAQHQIQRLLMGQVDMYDLIISGQLSKYQSEYALPQPHAEVRELMEKRNPGSGPKIGDRVPYVLIDRGNKKAKRYECAEDPMYALEHHLPINTQYYMDKQILKPIIRIFKPIYPNAASRLTHGEHTRRIARHIRLDATKGLGRFVTTHTPCMGCGISIDAARVTSSNAVPICSNCEPRRLDLFANAQRDYNAASQTYSRIWTNCQQCQGSLHQEVICSAQDCIVFYKRISARDEFSRLQKVVHTLDW